MAQLNVNYISNRNDTGAPELTYGATVPSGKEVSGAGGIEIVGVVTATSFVGDGSTLASYTNASKGYAIKLIIDPIPFRS